MLTFRSLTEVEQAQLTPKHRRAVTRAMRSLLDAYGNNYNPDDCGFVVLLNQHTTDADALKLMGRPWAEARLEGVSFDRETNCFFTVWLANNQYGLTFLVPNEVWLDPAFRALLLDELGRRDAS
ncbi:hypothetical protein [Geobacter sp. SVR]|uniref:hypothetical protein n=1 Tax=Geobacter sp. SVR TaxID=2495594 RepID=UPI00143EFDBA|nr:hypothetical protein [Geobacter sp. SVR]BCS55612.1 hypothetical protein GSVR_39200 [Geobacter sp. SVR]GCF83615.1 hypothetical protein GSbR_02150 [Geobacter sp. SVR]